MRLPRPIRCEWCIEGDKLGKPHEDCVTILEMSGPRQARHIKLPKHLWRCGCSCIYAQTSKCLDCQRRNVVVDRTSRCVDKAECAATEIRPRPAPLYTKDYA